MRRALTRLLLAAGFGLTFVSFAAALPLRLPGTPGLGPVPALQGTGVPTPYLPAFFILGIMLMFLSAVAYELLPDRGADR